MIKLLDVKAPSPHQLELTFSAPAYFARCFVDAGALFWPNGMELSAARLYELSRVSERVA